MGSMYLAGDDLAAYGVPDATPAQIQSASDVIDSYLKRPEGLVWTPDFQGNPAYMAALSPSLIFTATAGFGPGAAVVAHVTGPLASSDLVGEVLILDRADPSKVEAVTIQAFDRAAGTITLVNVATAHSTGALLEAGLVMLEERALPAKRSVTRLSKNPAVRLLSGMGRYAYGRRSAQVAGMFPDASLISTLNAIGGVPTWQPFSVDPVNGASVSPATGEVWIPAGMYLAYFSDVRIRYVAGFSAAGLPGRVKQACANVVSQLIEFPEISGNFKKIQAGGTVIERWRDTVLDSDSRALLSAFESRVFF